MFSYIAFKKTQKGVLVQTWRKYKLQSYAKPSQTFKLQSSFKICHNSYHHNILLGIKKKKKYRTFWGTLHISAKINHWLLSLQKTRYIQIYSLKSLLSRKILKHVVNLSRQLNCIYLFFIHWKRHLRIRELFTYIAK